MQFSKALGLIALTVAAGCNLTGDPTNSSFATPSSSGRLSEASDGRTGSDFSFLTGNGYAYQVGAVSNDGLQGFAGIVPGAEVTAAPATGSAQFTGTFEVALIGSILTYNTEVSGQTTFDAGTITLTADFDDNTLTGGGTGVDGGSFNYLLRENVLTIDGDLSGSTLTGTATYRGVTGPLRGLVGSNEAIGAFHGHTDSQVHAGGFIAN